MFAARARLVSQKFIPGVARSFGHQAGTVPSWGPAGFRAAPGWLSSAFRTQVPKLWETGVPLGLRGGGRRLHIGRPGRAAEKDNLNSVEQHVEYSGLWGAITTFPKRRPYITNLVIATLKTAFADYTMQMAEGNDFDYKRHGVFWAFGFFYLGAFQWFVYVTVFSKLCPNAVRFANQSWAAKLKDRPGQIDLIKQTALDNFVHYTFIYFPFFYCFKEAIQGDSGQDPITISRTAIGRYWKNFYTDNAAMWSLWIPGDLAIYAVPIWMRLPLNHAVSFIWTMILSWMRGGKEEEPQKEASS